MSDQGRMSVTSQGSNLGSAMGFQLCWLVIFGALAGQTVSVVFLCLWWWWFRANEDFLTDLLAKSIQLAVKECALSHHDPPGLHPEVTVPVTPSFLGSGPVSVSISGLSGFIAGFTILAVPLWCCRGRSIEKDPVPSLVLSPAGSPLSIEQIARNQLAEVRLRRYGADRPVRSA